MHHNSLPDIDVFHYYTKEDGFVETSFEKPSCVEAPKKGESDKQESKVYESYSSEKGDFERQNRFLEQGYMWEL